MQRYASFAEFYPFYLSEHSARTTRRLHFLGSGLALLCLLELALSGNPLWLAAGLLCGLVGSVFAVILLTLGKTIALPSILPHIGGGGKSDVHSLDFTLNAIVLIRICAGSRRP